MIQFDFKRLLDLEFEVPPLDSGLTWRTIRSIFRRCEQFSTDSGDISPERNESPDPFHFEDPVVIYFVSELSIVPSALIHLLQRPRILKSALRRTWVAWQTLHGEVSLRDLLVWSTIVTVDSAASSFVREARHLLVGEKEDSRKEAEKLWGELRTAAAQDAKTALWTLVQYLLPPASRQSISKPQGVKSDRHWIRTVSGFMAADAVRDQTVLHDFLAFKTGGNSEPLVNGLFDSRYGDAFETLYEARLSDRVAMGVEEAMDLATLVFRNLRETGVSATLDRAPGVFSLWRVMKKGERHYDRDAYATWVAAEITAAALVGMKLATEIEYYWAGKYTPAEGEASATVRQHVIQWAEHNLSAGLLTQVLSAEHPYLLRHFVLGPPRENLVPEPQWSLWGMLRRLLPAALEANPSLMLPQIVLLFSDSSTRITSEGLEEIHRIKRDWLLTLFVDLETISQFVSALLAKADSLPPWPSQHTVFMEPLLRELRQWRSEGLTGA